MTSGIELGDCPFAWVSATGVQLVVYSVSEAIQLLVLAVCFALALVRALRVRNAPWLSIVCFFACTILGNVYWYGFMIVFGETPHYSYIAELSWIAGYIFLLMLLIECDQQRAPAAPVPIAWLPVAACGLCCICYIVTSGSPFLNLVDNGLMAALGFFAVRGLVAHSEKNDGAGFASNRFLHAALLAFVIIEQVLWLSSLLPNPEADFAIYTIVNYVLTVSYAAILACAWRSDEL